MLIGMNVVFLMIRFLVVFCNIPLVGPFCVRSYLFGGLFLHSTPIPLCTCPCLADCGGTDPRFLNPEPLLKMMTKGAVPGRIITHSFFSYRSWVSVLSPQVLSFPISRFPNISSFPSPSMNEKLDHTTLHLLNFTATLTPACHLSWWTRSWLSYMTLWPRYLPCFIFPGSIFIPAHFFPVYI